MKIVSMGSEVEIVNKEHWRVRSEWWTVKKDEWQDTDDMAAKSHFKKKEWLWEQDWLKEARNGRILMEERGERLSEMDSQRSIIYVQSWARSELLGT